MQLDRERMALDGTGREFYKASFPADKIEEILKFDGYKPFGDFEISDADDDLKWLSFSAMKNACVPWMTGSQDCVLARMLLGWDEAYHFAQDYHNWLDYPEGYSAWEVGSLTVEDLAEYRKELEDLGYYRDTQIHERVIPGSYLNAYPSRILTYQIIGDNCEAVQQAEKQAHKAMLARHNSRLKEARNGAW